MNDAEQVARAVVTGLAGVLLVAIAAGAVISACGENDANFCDPSVWAGGAFDPHRLAACCPVDPTIRECPDAGNEGGDAGDGSADGPIGEDCAEECLPVPQAGWTDPLLAWIGPEFQAPACPPKASVEGPDGYADLSAPDLCGACSCGPPTGACALPETLTANSSACPGSDPGTAHMPFDPPDGGWDGGCTANDGIDCGQIGDGGSCVQSITIAPLTLSESGCVPTLGPSTRDPPSWGTFARLCRGEPFGRCGNDGLRCSPSAPPGFRACIYQKEDNDCPGDRYTEKHLFYKGFQDTRMCSPCTCGSATGSTCSSTISIYADGACATTPTYTVTVDSTGPLCDGVIPGTALSSKSATAPTYVPGTCQPSGGPTGAATATGPFTLCCSP
jgi:hypothetical protein